MSKETLCMSKKLDDLNLEDDLLRDPSDEVKETIIELDAEPLEPVEQVDPEEEEYKAAEARLSAQQQTWICLPSVTESSGDGPAKLTMIVRDLEDCDPTTFFQWICHVYPMAKQMDHTAEDYAEPDHRLSAWAQVIARLKQLKFPPSGLPKRDKVETKDSVKTEKE